MTFVKFYMNGHNKKIQRTDAPKHLNTNDDIHKSNFKNKIKLYFSI